MTMLYDSAGNTVEVQDASGNRTLMSYDALNRLRSRLDSHSKQTVYAYDADSRLVGVTDRLNRQRVYNYDDADRLTGETWKDAAGTVAQLLTYTYDAADQMLSASNGAGVYSFGYDLAGRVQTVAEPYNLSLTFTYDAAGERTQVADSFGGVTTSVYDDAGRLTSRQLGGAVAAPARVDYGYSNRNELTGITRYSDLAGASKVGTTSYSYDDVGRLSNIQHNNASGGGLGNYTYTYDAADRLTAKTDNGVTTPYNYYDDNQLQQDGAATYSYDATGNRTNPGYTTGPDNRITSDGTWTYSYDDEGNTIKKTKGVNAETWTYGYDNANRLIWSEQRATDGGQLLARVEYTYDVFGNRIRRVQYDGAMTVVSDQRFGYDGWDTAQPEAIGNENFEVYVDLDGGNNITARRIYGAGFDQPAARVDANGVAWYLTDRQGSVRQLLDNSGSVVASSDFDAFGNLIAGALTDRLGYAGREWDSTLGVYYQRARLYAPTIGRFFQEDPTQFAAGDPNLFRYTGNSPTNATDPSGLDRLILLKGAIPDAPTQIQYRVERSWWNPRSDRDYNIGEIRTFEGKEYVDIKGWYVPRSSVEEFASDWYDDPREMTAWAKRHAINSPGKDGSPLPPGLFTPKPKQPVMGHAVIEGRPALDPNSLPLELSPQQELQLRRMERKGWSDLELAANVITAPAAVGGIYKLGRAGIGRLVGKQAAKEIAATAPGAGGTPLPIVRAPVTGPVGYGSTDLSRVAQAHRVAEGLINSGKNIAVIEYRAADGSLKTVVKASEFTQGHAERLAAKELETLGVKPEQVNRIYSELQPCVLPTEPSGCATFLKKTFPQAEVTWSFEYGATPASRKVGREALKQAAGELGK